MEAVVLLGLFVVLLVIGVPIAFSIGLAVLAVLVYSDLTVLVFAQRIANAADNFALLAIPLFILAGELMNRGGMTLRLVDFAQAVIGHIRGGLGHSCVLASLIFANVSGSAVADTTAVGSVMVPAMKNKGYNPRFVASLQASAGLLAPIIPPSILLILYGSIINVSIGGLFLAAVVPGLLIAAGLMVMVFIMTAPRFQPDIQRERFAGMQRIRETGLRSIPALGMPVIIIGGIVGGVFTATEAGAVAVVYAFVVGKFLYRSFTFAEVPSILLAAGSLTVMVMSIIVFAAVFGWLLAILGVPVLIIDFMTTLTENPYIFLVLTIVFVLVLGTVMEVLAIATIFGPLLNTLAIHYGFDPIFFGVIIAITMQLGGITPPVGILLNITCAMAGTRPGQCLGYISLFILVILSVLALMIAFPELMMWLPRTFM
jgi:tripartite ATP-independent transporter DctM subunit